MNKKRLVMSLGMLAFVGAVVVGGTGAFFSDTETSTGNVFTAGSVSLTLGATTHQWLGAPETTLPTNYFMLGDTNNIVMGDLKPGDNGLLTTPVTNGANDAFMCARVTAVNPNDPLAKIADYLKFRTGTGPGGSVSDILAVVPVGKWFSPAAPALDLPAVPLPANATGGVALEYCFGDFIPGSLLGKGCTVNPATNYNDAQLSSLSIDLEYYVVQQRNNENFSCADLNTKVTTNTGWSPNAADQLWFAKSRNNNGGFETAVGSDDSTVPGQDTREAVWVAGQEYPFTLEYDADTDTASYTAGGGTVTYPVGAGPFTTLGITAKAPANETTTVANLALDIYPALAPTSVVATGGNSYIQATGLDFSQDWTLTGTFTFSAVGTGSGFSQENPAVQFSIN